MANVEQSPKGSYSPAKSIDVMMFRNCICSLLS